mmetsp:Transcript_90472/g.160246  ORF Transcript_90472/g.160246 Transcript_90472/m.160246 type:complete len:127 (-) Transcript_90472:150-530(-)
MPKVYQGTLRNWREEKGFGFLIRDEGGADIFMHVTDVEDGDRNRGKFRDGDRFSFEEGEDKHGKLIATNAVWEGEGGGGGGGGRDSRSRSPPRKRRPYRSRSRRGRRQRDDSRDDSRDRGRGRRRR